MKLSQHAGSVWTRPELQKNIANLTCAEALNREFYRKCKQPWRQRQQRRHKSNGFNNQNNNSTRVSWFFVHLPCKTTTGNIALWRIIDGILTLDDSFFSLFLNFDSLPFNPTPGKLAYNSTIESVKITALKFRRTRMLFINDVSFAVTILVDYP